MRAVRRPWLAPTVTTRAGAWSGSLTPVLEEGSAEARSDAPTTSSDAGGAGASWPGPRPNAHHSLSRARTRDRASVRTRRARSETFKRERLAHLLGDRDPAVRTDAKRDLRPHGRRAMAWAIHALSRPGPRGMQWALPLAALLCRCRSGGIRLVPGAPSLSHRVSRTDRQEHRPSRTASRGLQEA